MAAYAINISRVIVLNAPLIARLKKSWDIGTSGGGYYFFFGKGVKYNYCDVGSLVLKWYFYLNMLGNKIQSHIFYTQRDKMGG